MARKHPGVNQQTGRLKKGYSYDKGGRIVKAKPEKRTKFYKCAKTLGSQGGRASAAKRRQPGLF